MSLPQFAQLIACGEEDAVRNLLEHPSERKPSFLRSVRAGNDQALIEACRWDRTVDIVIGLIAHGSDYKAQKHEPLRTAVRFANHEVINALIENGYDDPAGGGDDQADLIPSDILNMAIAVCGASVAMRLLAVGAVPDSMSLDRAITRRDINLLEDLLFSGADPNGVSGRHPLSTAARDNLVQIGEILLKKGADPQKFNKSAAKVARAHGHEEFLELLRRHSPFEVSEKLKASAEEMAKPKSGPGVWF